MKVQVHNTEESCITYHVAIYYERVGENPDIRHNEDQHIALINHVNERYLKALNYIPPGLDARGPLDYEGYKDKFIENIDYLTGVFTKKREKEKKSEEIRAFRERNAKKSKFV